MHTNLQIPADVSDVGSNITSCSAAFHYCNNTSERKSLKENVFLWLDGGLRVSAHSLVAHFAADRVEGAGRRMESREGTTSPFRPCPKDSSLL